jgi:L-alanine-DL-glutamate epimerase-like enolase superfamily enzyme
MTLEFWHGTIGAKPESSGARQKSRSREALMKIKEVHITSSVLDKQDKDWKFALMASPQARGYVITVEDEDGALGYGYSSAMPHYGSTLEGVKAALEMFRGRMIGKEANGIAAINDDLDKVLVGNNQAKSGVDCALFDLKARRLGVPIYELFGGSSPDMTEFPSLRILPIKKPHEMAANARRLYDKGVRHFKIKVHGDVDEDVACVKAIREEVGAEANLTIDANQSYSPKSAIQALERMAPFKIDLCEQPVPFGDIRGLKLVTDTVPIIVEADEAAYSLEMVAMIVRERAADAVSLKLSKLGGLSRTYAAAKICEAAGIRYRFGAHSGPQILAAHAVNLAAALPGIWYANEITEFEGLAEDWWEGLDVKDGRLKLPTAPGCGVTPKKGTPVPQAKAGKKVAAQ